MVQCYAYVPEIRKRIYTTKAIESLNMQLRKMLKNRGHFLSDEASAGQFAIPFLDEILSSASGGKDNESR